LPPAEALTLAQSLLNSGRAFSAHEVLEAAWKAAPAAERDLWQGLAQVCVGITHAQRGNATGSARLLDRGIDRLRHYAANPPHRVDVSGLLDWHAQHATNPTATDPPRLLAVRPDQSSS
jgi:predicted metal-dependent hydrolase